MAVDVTPTAVGVDATLAVICGIVTICCALAASGRFHSNVPMVRAYFIVCTLGFLLRTCKFAVPNFAFYKPFEAPPEVDSGDWWLQEGEFLVYVASNAAIVIAYGITLRMWHQALQIVSGQAPNWVQVVLLYAIALSVVFDVALTILLAFVVPDIINTLNAFKDAVIALILVAAFIAYWAMLRRALQLIAQLARGQPGYAYRAGNMTPGGAAGAGGHPAVDPSNIVTISERALRKLRRISWVSAVCTLGSLYRAASLLYFALAVTRLTPYVLLTPTYGSLQRLFYFAIGDVLPTLSMLFIMLKPANCGPWWGCRCCCRGRQSYQQLDAAQSRSGSASRGGHGSLQVAPTAAAPALLLSTGAGAAGGGGGGSGGLGSPGGAAVVSTNLHKMSMKPMAARGGVSSARRLQYAYAPAVDVGVGGGAPYR